MKRRVKALVIENYDTMTVHLLPYSSLSFFQRKWQGSPQETASSVYPAKHVFMYAFSPNQQNPSPDTTHFQKAEATLLWQFIWAKRQNNTLFRIASSLTCTKHPRFQTAAYRARIPFITLERQPCASGKIQLRQHQLCRAASKRHRPLYHPVFL